MQPNCKYESLVALTTGITEVASFLLSWYAYPSVTFQCCHQQGSRRLNFLPQTRCHPDGWCGVLWGGNPPPPPPGNNAPQSKPTRRVWEMPVLAIKAPPDTVLSCDAQEVRKETRACSIVVTGFF